MIWQTEIIMRKDKIIDKQTGKLRKRYFNEHGGWQVIKGTQEAKDFFNAHPKLIENQKKWLQGRQESRRLDRLMKQI